MAILKPVLPVLMSALWYLLRVLLESVLPTRLNTEKKVLLVLYTHICYSWVHSGIYGGFLLESVLPTRPNTQKTHPYMLHMVALYYLLSFF